VRRLLHDEWDAGTHIELVADALPGFGSARTGACAGTSDSTCFVELGARTEAGAVFRPLRRLALQITGRGTVTVSDLRCALVLDAARRGLPGRAACEGRARLAVRPLEQRVPGRTRPACTLQVGSGGVKTAAVFGRSAR